MRPPSEGKDERRSRLNASQRTRYNQMPEEKKQVLLQQRRQRYAQNKKAKQTGSQAQSPEIDRVAVRSCEVLIVDEINNFNPKIDTCAGKTDKEELLPTTEKERTRIGSSSTQPHNILQSTMGSHLHPPGIKSRSCLSNTSQPYSYTNKGIIIEDLTAQDATCRRNQQKLLRTCERDKYPISFYSSFDIGSPSTSSDGVVHLKSQSTQAAPGSPSTSSDGVVHLKSQSTQAAPDHSPTKVLPTHKHDHTYGEMQSTKRKRSALKKGKEKQHQDLLKNIPDRPLVLPPTRSCQYCAAKQFYHESKGFCCSNGEVALISNRTPDELYHLYTSNTKRANEFKTYIRTYNNTFAFTSLGVKYDKDLCRRNKGIYTFKIQGQMYHFINEIIPTDNNPSYLQLFFYDTEHEIDNRTKQSAKLNSSIVEELANILRINPYAVFFRSLTNILPLSEERIVLKTDARSDQRVFNAPSSSQIAAIWLENTETYNRQGRDIIIYNHSSYKHQVEHYFGCYDPLQYPLLFPYGETGWHQGIQRVTKREKSLCAGQLLVNPLLMKSDSEILQKEKKVLSSAKKDSRDVSCREYYCYKLQIRPNDQSILLRAGRLLQQYAVDMYVKLETSRLDYFRQNQKEIRAEVYQGIKDSVAIGETRASKVGKRIVLPSSFTGGPRDMHARYMDAMTLVQKFGKPDILLTMTCNPNWPEIKSELFQGEESQNRPDLCARVFKAKVELLKEDLIKNEILGPVAAYTYVIEYQKRGLPHAHFALIFTRNAKLLSPDSYDRLVCAELPDQEINPHLYNMVVRHMMHGPCGIMNPENICMKRDGQCKNHYPKKYSPITTQGDDSYPIYRRRDDGKQVKVRKHTLDNRWVVPYNPYLLAKYDCHINVEICSSFKIVKYLYKYIYKGHDQVAFNVGENEESAFIDEIQQFQSARWISAAEAMWRIYRFKLNEMHPAVYSLRLHLEGKQLITFTKYDKLDNILKYDNSSKTMLTEFFRYNESNKEEDKYLYKEFPEHFVWDQQKKLWTKRKQNYVIGRIITANPTEGERYYLRMLLNHVKGPTSFEYLRSVEGRTVATFREAALLHGLLESDNSLEQCLQEAESYQMPETLRRLFATILVYCTPTDPKRLWDKFEHAMIEDYIKKYPAESPRRAHVRALQNVRSKLETMGKNIRQIREYGLSNDKDIYAEKVGYSKEMEDELNFVITDEDINSVSTLNLQQKYAYDIITNRIVSNKSGAFFIDGPGGTGKTYLYCAILAAVRSRGLIALATATSGVAASILPGGRTAHSRFKIPIDIDENKTCNVSKQTGLGKLIREAKLIIWDEATMAKRQVIEALNNMLQDINDCTLPFGGKVVIFGGDFRQILPVIPKATKEETIDATLLRSQLWSLFEKIRLTENMRAKFDNSFTNFLLRIGNGTEPLIYDDKIAIPIDMLLPYSDHTESIKLLAQHVFPKLHQYAEDPKQMTYRAILTPTNDYVDDINNLLLDSFPGIITEYKSFDKTLDKFEQGLHEDLLNTLNPIGLPPHLLILKPNCPIILLRNIDPPQGLCNGTRLICRALTKNMIYAEIVVGCHEGRKVFIPRIPLQPSDNHKYPIPFERKQFPVRLCFAMTINKAQGQTLETVRLYLPRPVFSHGQLYVALSRARTSKTVKILIKPTSDNATEYNCTKNVVFEEILALADM